MFDKSKLTRDVLKHRGWVGETKCTLCSREESIDHLAIVPWQSMPGEWFNVLLISVLVSLQFLIVLVGFFIFLVI